jgi:PAS domain S-box-containing protein
VIDSFPTSVDFLVFLCGLAFLLMAAALEQRSREERHVVWDLLLCFALLQGVSDWCDVLSRLLPPSPAFALARVVLSAAALVIMCECGWPSAKGRTTLARALWLPVLGLSLLGPCLAVGLEAGLAISRCALSLPTTVLAALALGRVPLRPTFGREHWRRRLAPAAMLAFGIVTAATATLELAGGVVGLSAKSPLAGTVVSLHGIRVACIAALYLDIRRNNCSRRADALSASYGWRWTMATLFTLITVVGWVTSDWCGKDADAMQHEQLASQAANIARMIDPDIPKRLTFSARDQGMPLFQRLQRQLSSLARVTAARGIYTAVVRDGQLVLGPAVHPGDEHLAFSPGTVLQRSAPVGDAVLHTGRAITCGPLRDGRGAFYSAFAPLFDPVTNRLLMIVGLDADAGDWSVAIQAARVPPIVMTMIFLLLALALKSGIQHRESLPLAQQLRLRHLETCHTALVGLALTVAATAWVYNAEQRARCTSLDRLVTSCAESLADEFQTICRDVKSISSFFASSQQVTEEEFLRFTEPMTGRAVTAGWISIQRAAERDEQHSVCYASSWAELDWLRAFDFRDGSLGRAVLDAASAAGLPTASAPISISGDPPGRLAALVVQPVYEEQPLGPEQDAGPSRPAGYAAMAVWLDALLARLERHAGTGEKLLHVQLLDERQCSTAGIRSTAAVPTDFHEPNRFSHRFAQLVPLPISGATYAVAAQPTAAFFALHPLRATWLTAMASLVLSGVLTALVGRMRDHRLELERIVRQRTKELREREEDLSVTLKSVAESEQRLRTFCDSALNAVVMLDGEGKAILWNPAAEKMFGYSAAEVLGHDIHKIIAPPELDVLFRQRFARFVATGQGTAVGRVVELNALHRDGHLIPVEMALSAFAKDGKWLAVGIIREISERKRAEAAERAQADSLRAANRSLAQLHQAAESATRAKSEFLANMSHEIRTPITAILGYADILVEEDGDGATREHAGIIKRNAEHLLELINDILDLSRVEAGKLCIERQLCSPAQLIEDVAALMRVRADAKHLTLQTVVDPSVGDRVFTDPLRLRQVLVNLLGNAIKFTNAGTVRVTARQDGAQQPPQLRIEVHDTGIGMTSEQIARLFQPFMQVDASAARRHGGSGLGLAISKRLIELLEGTISVHSVPGQGSTFTVCLGVDIPPGATTEPAPPVEDSPLRGDAVSESLVRGRVLLAEDGPDNRRLVSFLLKHAGIDVTAVENGSLALDHALAAWRQDQPYDLILMDMQMPVLDGYTATRRLRELGYPGTIVALTAHALQEDRTRCLEAGCDDYTTKPFDRSRLLAIVKRYCRAARDRNSIPGAALPAWPECPLAETRA